MKPPQKYASATAFRVALEDRLKKLAQEDDLDLQRVRRQAAFDRLLCRLFAEPDAPWLLKVNGEAIYRTRPWKVQHEGDVCFTAKGDYVYARFLKWPGAEFKLKSVRPVEGSIITMLGVPGNRAWTWNDANGLSLQYPNHKARPSQCSYAWAFKIKVK